MRLRRFIIGLLLVFGACFSFAQVYGQKSGGSTSKTSTNKTTKQQSNNTKSKDKSANKRNDKLNRLKQEKRDLDRQVRHTDQKLSSARKSTRQGLRELERLNANIRERNEVINRQNQQIKDLADHIDGLNQDLLQLEMNYDVSKRKYVELVYNAYQKNSVYDNLLFVFSARTVQESFYRFQYISQFASLRRQQAHDIQSSKADLAQKKQELLAAKDSSERLLANREAEKKQMEADQREQKDLVATLKKQERQLRKELNQRQKEANAMNRRIQEYIDREVEREMAASGKNNRTSNSQKTEKTHTTTVKKTGPEPSKFSETKGRMHWPVWRGTITGHFGIQPDPVFKDITVNNKGVYITSPAGTEALAVYDGQVKSIFSGRGMSSAVIVRHGNYLTVYADVTEVYVKEGQMVKRGDKLAKVYIEPDDPEHCKLFFQIWKERTVQNPESWLRPLK